MSSGFKLGKGRGMRPDELHAFLTETRIFAKVGTIGEDGWPNVNPATIATISAALTALNTESKALNASLTTTAAQPVVTQIESDVNAVVDAADQVRALQHFQAAVFTRGPVDGDQTTSQERKEAAVVVPVAVVLVPFPSAAGERLLEN